MSHHPVGTRLRVRDLSWKDWKGEEEPGLWAVCWPDEEPDPYYKLMTWAVVLCFVRLLKEAGPDDNTGSPDCRDFLKCGFVERVS